MVETFGSGRPVSHWSRRAPKPINGIRPTVVRDAALRAYPALKNLTAILPPDLDASLPVAERERAVGLYLTHWESRVMQGALGYIRAYDVIGLPMHDALIVPEGAAKVAREAREPLPYSSRSHPGSSDGEGSPQHSSMPALERP